MVALEWGSLIFPFPAGRACDLGIELRDVPRCSGGERPQAERAHDRQPHSQSGRSPAAAKAHLVFAFALPLAGLALMRMCPPSIFSTSNAPVFRARSLSLLWP